MMLSALLLLFAISANAAPTEDVNTLSAEPKNQAIEKLSSDDIDSLWEQDHEDELPGIPAAESVQTKLASVMNETLNLNGASSRKYSVVVAQIEPTYKNPKMSMEKIDRMLEKHRGKSIDLIVAPEMGLSGYKFDNKEDVAPVTESQYGITYEWAKAKALEFNAWVMVGFPETVAATGNFHNSALVVDNKGNLVHVVRKTNLTPSDRKWAEKNPDYLSIIDTERFGRMGIAICADISATSREKGKWVADNFFRMHNVNTIVLMAAWDTSKAITRVHSDWMARFGQNVGQNVVFIAADRTGSEKGVPFSGSSAVIDLHNSRTLARFDQNGEGLLVANVEQTPTDVKGFKPAEYHLD